MEGIQTDKIWLFLYTWTNWIYSILLKVFPWFMLLCFVVVQDYFIGTGAIISLTHWGCVTHICIGKLNIIGSDNGLSHGRRQAIIRTNAGWNIVNKTLRNKLQWNFNRNSNIFIQENAFESVVCKKAAILSRPECVNPVPMPDMAK